MVFPISLDEMSIPTGIQSLAYVPPDVFCRIGADDAIDFALGTFPIIFSPPNTFNF